MKSKFGLSLSALLISAVVFAIGLILILNSPALGQRAASDFLRFRHGGSMDTGQFEIILSSSIRAYSTAGFALSLPGGLGVILSGCALYNYFVSKSEDNKEIL